MVIRSTLTESAPRSSRWVADRGAPPRPEISSSNAAVSQLPLPSAKRSRLSSGATRVTLSICTVPVSSGNNPIWTSRARSSTRSRSVAASGPATRTSDADKVGAGSMVNPTGPSIAIVRPVTASSWPTMSGLKRFQSIKLGAIKIAPSPSTRNASKP